MLKKKVSKSKVDSPNCAEKFILFYFYPSTRLVEAISWNLHYTRGKSTP